MCVVELVIASVPLTPLIKIPFCLWVLCANSFRSLIITVCLCSVQALILQLQFVRETVVPFILSPFCLSACTFVCQNIRLITFTVI